VIDHGFGRRHALAVLGRPSFCREVCPAMGQTPARGLRGALSGTASLFFAGFDFTAFFATSVRELTADLKTGTVRVLRT
jgi:hypothetical protein